MSGFDRQDFIDFINLRKLQGALQTQEDDLPDALSKRLKTILVVDDKDDSRITAKFFLNNFGYTVDTAKSALDALLIFDANLHDIVVADSSLPGMSGLELAHVIKLRCPGTPVILFSGTALEDNSCVDAVILRPVHLLSLKEAIDNLAKTVRPVVQQRIAG